MATKLYRPLDMYIRYYHATPISKY